MGDTPNWLGGLKAMGDAVIEKISGTPTAGPTPSPEGVLNIRVSPSDVEAFMETRSMNRPSKQNLRDAYNRASNRDDGQLPTVRDILAADRLVQKETSSVILRATRSLPTPNQP